MVHHAVDEFSRVAYAELLPDGRKGTCAAFMGRALRFFAGLGVAVERVMTDNGPGYRSGEFNTLLDAAGARHVYARPFNPWQNGKVERMNRTIAREWQYKRAYGSEAERADAPSRRTLSTIIGTVCTAPAGTSRPCRASSV